jgi:alkylhydroperoxidase family enzyme
MPSRPAAPSEFDDERLRESLEIARLYAVWNRLATAIR